MILAAAALTMGTAADAQTMIQKNDIKVENHLMTPEALWAMGRIGGAEASGHRLPVSMPRGDNDALCAELLRGEHPHESHGTVTHDGDGLAQASARGVGGKPSGTKDVGGGQQRWDEVVIRLARKFDESSVSVRNTGTLRLHADGAVHELRVHAA